MKPCFLEFCGINSFSDRTEIDFNKLSEYGIFGIFGDTGSGKSTILDCICLALYGEIRRARKLSEVINYKLEKAWVKFTFECIYEGRRRRYLVEREIGRKAGSNAARLSEWVENAWQAITDRIDETDACIKRVMGLERQDFERCIALPQGEFAQFIKATPSDRLKLIARLFDLEAYGAALTEKVNRRFYAAESERKAAEVRMEQYAEVSEEKNAALRAQLEAGSEARKALREKLRAAKEEADMLSARLERGELLKKTEARLSELEAKREQFSLLESELARLERAAAVCTAKRDGMRLRSVRDEKGNKRNALKNRLDEAERALQNLMNWDEEAATLEIERLAAATEQAAFLKEEYAVFAGEVEGLTQKYPVIEKDSLPISQKYRALSTGERIDFSRILKPSEGEEGHSKENTGELPASVAEAKQLLSRKRKERTDRLAERKRATEFLAAMRTDHAAAEAAFEAAEHALMEGRERYTSALTLGGFADAEEAEALLKKYGNPKEAQRELSAYRAECAALTAKRAELSDGAPEVAREQVTSAKTEVEKLEAELAALERTLAVAETELKRGESMLESKHALQKEYEAALKKEALWSSLQKLFARGRFMEYAAEEYLQTVAVNASERLLSLTDGRYFLRYEGGFFVGDNFNGGQLRAVGTLSGGETFLVSLSLALSLSAEICARSMRPIEFFFLDEGFGTLDARLVDVVMDSLEKLRSEEFCIGIISHVGELKQRIHRKLLVTRATESSGSKIVTE